MRIIKNGEFKKTNSIICAMCDCEFKYFESEVQTREDKYTGGTWVIKYLECPCCKSHVILHANMVKNKTLFDIFRNMFKKKNKDIINL